MPQLGMDRRVVLCVVAACALASGAMGVTLAPAQADEPTALYLVTLEGSGTAGYRGALPTVVVELPMRAEQERLLDLVDAPAPAYSWTTALNGFAAELTPSQADQLAGDPAVTLVETNEVRPLAAATTRTARGAGIKAPGRGGAGTVIGVIDTGISPESPLFAAVPRLGRTPSGFRGGCAPGQDWDAESCNGKLVGAQWFVAGFGEDNLRAASSLSPRDGDGHGTQMASIAAGNAGVSVRVRGESLGSYGGMAPQARIAAYKACWSAPDPADDGCASADLVAAIDHATRDGVDVLSLSVGGPSDAFDTVERALLGAAEADIVVAASAGNAGDRQYAAHPSPWVTTVGGITGVERQGEVILGSEPSLTGVMVSSRGAGPARLVRGADVAARDASRSEARVCAPGSLDAAEVAGRIVLCERGEVGRVDKSRTVGLADGVAMVLVNEQRGSVDADFHSVPTVHLGQDAGRALTRWLLRNPSGTVALRPLGVARSQSTVAPWSSGGDPSGGVLKPDVVAPATGRLGAVPASTSGVGWDFVTGTSAATAYTSGVAATLLSRRGWSAADVRSALATTAGPLAGASTLLGGAGRVRPADTASPGLVYRVDRDDYRAWLEGRLRELNTPSLLLSGGDRVARRTVTNVGDRSLYFSSDHVGFRRPVEVTPAAVTLDPGESATFEVEVAGRGPVTRIDDGYVVWRGANGTIARMPVLISR
ncbi:MAG: S8 family serine peptidase [Nocardioides sp.]